MISAEILYEVLPKVEFIMIRSFMYCQVHASSRSCELRHASRGYLTDMQVYGVLRIRCIIRRYGEMIDKLMCHADICLRSFAAFYVSTINH
jgi:hypothetical protein